SILQTQGLRHAFLLIHCQGWLQVSVAADRAGQRYRIFHRELCSRSNRKVGGVRGIADQNDVPVKPSSITYPYEAQPRCLFLVFGIEKQAVITEPATEKSLASTHRLACSHLVESRAAPGVFIALDDECCRIFVERVTVRLKNPTLALDEQKGKCLELVFRAEPYILRFADGRLRIEKVGVPTPNTAVDTIGCHNQVGRR